MSCEGYTRGCFDVQNKHENGRGRRNLDGSTGSNFQIAKVRTQRDKDLKWHSRFAIEVINFLPMPGKFLADMLRRKQIEDSIVGQIIVKGAMRLLLLCIDRVSLPQFTQQKLLTTFVFLLVECTGNGKYLFNLLAIIFKTFLLLVKDIAPVPKCLVTPVKKPFSRH